MPLELSVILLIAALLTGLEYAIAPLRRFPLLGGNPMIQLGILVCLIYPLFELHRILA